MTLSLSLSLKTVYCKRVFEFSLILCHRGIKFSLTVTHTQSYFSFSQAQADTDMQGYF